MVRTQMHAERVQEWKELKFQERRTRNNECECEEIRRVVTFRKGCRAKNSERESEGIRRVDILTRVDRERETEMLQIIKERTAKELGNELKQQ
jgi:hypothetical protein